MALPSRPRRCLPRAEAEPLSSGAAAAAAPAAPPAPRGALHPPCAPGRAPGPAAPRLLPTSLPLPERRGRPEEPPAPRPLPGPGSSARPARLRRGGGAGSAPGAPGTVPRRRPPGSDMGRGLPLLLLALALLAAPARAEGGTAAEEEVQIEVLHLPEACSPKSKKGDLLNAHYDGFLASDGSKFYCSRTQNEGHPKWFVLGVGQVIKGLDIAMMNMCPGEKRKVTIPPSLAYGQQGYAQGKIPPNATLVFEIELYAVNKGPRSVEAFNQIDKDGDKKLSELEISQYLKEEFARDGKKRHPSAHDEILADIFKKNDHDGDGFISAKEYNVYQHDEL
ncbi:peptidyl-prolyl cis-trans isomerase FKBP7 [Parus major]|uniref:peptidyl-prolyl cis-trans isomerase FKBP7 n=1 Tax=Parus major TaxID=9157 RepID=UPI0008F53F90|nr:peptidyl-prolyl cis-trans isomerase FKBP7 [Parus major]